MVFRFDSKLPTLNEYIDAERSNRFIAAKIKKTTTNNIRLEALSQTRDKFEGLYDVRITWHRANNRQDSDNIYFSAKFLFDGLVEAKILSGDGRKHIRHINNEIFTTGKDYCLVELIEVV